MLVVSLWTFIWLLAFCYLHLALFFPPLPEENHSSPYIYIGYIKGDFKISYNKAQNNLERDLKNQLNNIPFCWIWQKDINVNHRKIYPASHVCLSPHYPFSRPHTQQAELTLSLPFNFKTPYFKKRKWKEKNGISGYFFKDADTHLFSESQWVCHVKK